MAELSDVLEKWRRGFLLLALIGFLVACAGLQAAVTMVPWMFIVGALEFAFGWGWLEDHTRWVFGAAMIGWLPYDLALFLRTKDEADKQERLARQQAYEAGKANERTASKDRPIYS